MKRLKINRQLFEAILNKLPERYEDVKKGTPEEILDSIVIDISNPNRTIGIIIEAESDRMETELVEDVEDEIESFNRELSNYLDRVEREENRKSQEKAGIMAFLKDLNPELTEDQLDERAEVLLTIIESTK